MLIGVLLTSCLSPIESDDPMGPVMPESELQVDVHSISPGSNKIVMINNTPGVSVYWDYIIAASTRQRDTVLLPFLGTQTITMTAHSAGGPVKTTRQVTIDQIDYPLDEMWNLLAGSDEEGKTWVWATGRGGSGALYGNAMYDDGEPLWWPVGEEQLNSWGILYDEMKFDLNGGANYTLTKKGKDGAGPVSEIKDNFILDVDKKTIKSANGTPFIREEDKMPGPFLVYKLTEDEMTLAWFIEHDWGTEAYYWMFKRKGYEY